MNKAHTADSLLAFDERPPTGRARERLAPESACDDDDISRALVEQAREGDREAFAELYRLYGRMVHGVLLARVGHAEVDDLVQEVFLLAFRRLATLRDPRTFGGWLATIARNRAHDHHRRLRRTEELAEHVGTHDHARADALEALRLLRELPEAYRETLVMRLVEGMSGAEIAARTGLTPASVRVNLHRGTRLLRALVGRREETR